MLRRLRNMLFIYVCVTTCVLLVTALYITIFWPQVTLGVEILWQILLVSFLCSVINSIYPWREVGKRTMLFIYVLRYVVTNAIVLGCGIWFGWFYTNDLPMVLAMLFSIAVIFALVSVVAWKRGKQQAALMNERLQVYQQREEKV